jgi:hypothetical protein
MKSHYCHEEKTIIEFSGQCNWCKEKDMNANELADELDKSRQEPFTSEYLVGQAATMLRQQANEIIELECEKERQREKYEGMICDRDVEIEALKSVVYWLKENRPEVWDDIKKWRLE